MFRGIVRLELGVIRSAEMQIIAFVFFKRTTMLDPLFSYVSTFQKNVTIYENIEPENEPTT